MKACRDSKPNCKTVNLQAILLQKMFTFSHKILGTPIFYCGGSIQSTAWCPMPTAVDGNILLERDQYLALSVFHEEHKYRSASEATFESEYLIQIWNCRQLCNARSAQSMPELEMCIAHQYGRMWSLVWCPSGCYDKERLGLLAAACSDGTVRLFSIPNTSILEKEIKYKHKKKLGLNHIYLTFERTSSKPLILRAEANMTLRLNLMEISECTSLDWDSVLGHR